jgi:hypothetical protein
MAGIDLLNRAAMDISTAPSFMSFACDGKVDVPCRSSSYSSHFLF